MFTSNPFAELSAFISPTVMQTYIVVMILMVAGGTLFDMFHKKSATYFFRAWRNSKGKATRQLGGGEMTSLVIRTAVVEVLTSGEFCKVTAQDRAPADILRLPGLHHYNRHHGVLVPNSGIRPRPPSCRALWYLGALMVLVGGYWFWFFIRVDVAYEGNSPFRLVRADLFVVSLLGERDAGPGMGVRAGDGQHRVDKRVPGSVHPRHDGALRVGFVVEVLLICSTSPPRPSRKGWRRRTVRAICRPPPKAKPSAGGAL